MGFQETRTDLFARLQARLPEIEQAALTRVYSVSDPTEAPDPEYAGALPAAVAAGFEYGLDGIDCGEQCLPQIPTVLLTQARLAARNGVSLDTVLRRYFAGYTLFGDFLVEEAESAGLHGGPLKRLLRVQASRFDHLVAVIAEEYSREQRHRLGTVEQRRAERVRRLLGGELLDTAELAYDFAIHHLGVIGVGPGAPETIRGLAKALDCLLLLIHPGEGAAWAWLGARRPLDPKEIEHHVSRDWPGQVSLAVGEPAHGLTGWRLTHRQAQAALPIALRRPQALTRYADVALLASILQDDLLATSLNQLYLAPLGAERDGGKALRDTLRAYFTAERNVSSTAAALGVNRQTVVNRLRTIEERFDRSLNSCAVEVEAALRLEGLDYSLLPLSAYSSS